MYPSVFFFFFASEELCIPKRLSFFASGEGFPPQMSTLLDDHCGRCRIQPRDLGPRSPVRYQLATRSLVSHHIISVYWMGYLGGGGGGGKFA